MDVLKLWEKLKAIPKAPDPMMEAMRMIDSGELDKEEVAWAVSSMAMMPITILRTMEQ